MNIPKLIILVGIPGSGKTTFAKQYTQENPNTIHLSSDSIREELLNDINDQSNNNLVFTTMQNRAIEAFTEGHDVIYDCTSMTRKDRAGIINVCPKFVHIKCCVIWAPIEACISRDATRERIVGKEVIDKMLKRFQFPYYDEGIDEIEVVLPEDFTSHIYYIVTKNTMKIPHDNPHHTLPIYEHCKAAFDYAYEHEFDFCIQEAAMWHDCGKPYVKSFMNTKGEVADIAHFYGHQAVSSWVACGLVNNIDALWLISTHMDPFLNTKYYSNLPNFVKEMVDKLHECDLSAH